MAKEIKSKKYQGVYYRELDGGDRSYFLRVRLGAGTRRIPIGKKSEGITEAFCNAEKNRIVNAHRFGEDVAAQLARVKQDEPTFAELIDYYLETTSAKESTVKNVRGLRVVTYAALRRVTSADVQRDIDEAARRLRPSTVNQRLKLARMVFRHAIKGGKYRFSDPTTGVELRKAETIRKRYLTADEVARLLEAVEDKPRLLLFVRMSLCTGARISTLMQVHADDIEQDGRVRLVNTKSERIYHGYLDEPTMALVRGREGYVFARRENPHKLPGVHLIQRHLKAVLDELFNPPGTAIEDRVVCHTLRHSVATQMLNKGVPLEVVSKTLDHADITVTSRVYAKVAPELVRRSVHGLWD